MEASVMQVFTHHSIYRKTAQSYFRSGTYPKADTIVGRSVILKGLIKTVNVKYLMVINHVNTRLNTESLVKEIVIPSVNASSPKTVSRTIFAASAHADDQLATAPNNWFKTARRGG